MAVSTSKKARNAGKINHTPDGSSFFKYFKLLILALICATLFYPPFLRGLYFDKEQLPTMIFVLVIFAVFWSYKFFKGDRRFLSTPIDIASFGFAVIYMFVIFIAVDRHLATLEWLKYIMYFAVFIMLTELADSLKARAAILWVMIAAAIGLCILGIDGAAGERIVKPLNEYFFFNLIPIRFFGLFSGNRITSTLQYANALASYLTAAFFLCLGLTVISRRLWVKAVSGAASFMLLITFVFTESRGAYLIMPIAAVIYLIALPKGYRLKGVVASAGPIIAILLIISKMGGYMANPTGNGTSIWLSVFIGLAVSALLSVLLSHTTKWLEGLSWKLYAGIAAGTVFILTGIAVYVLNSTIPLVLVNEGGQAQVQKKVVLKTDTQYKLVYTVEDENKGNTEESYSLRVSSMSTAGILFNKEKELVSQSLKGSQGGETREISFKVPADSRAVNVYFASLPGKGKVTFYNAQIQDSTSGKKVKDIKLKYKYIPDRIASRIEDISAARSSIERSIFYKDALNVIKENLPLGAGGWAWSLLYFKHQSYWYVTAQAHSYFLQVAIECGIIGFVVLVFLLISIVAMFIMGRRLNIYRDETESILQASVFTAIIALFLHSTIDFNLSLASVSLLLWGLIAVFNSYFKYEKGLELIAGWWSLVIKKFSRYGNRQSGSNSEAADTRRKGSYTKKDEQPVSAGINLYPLIGFFATITILVVPLIFNTALDYKNSLSSARKADNKKSILNNAEAAASTNPLDLDHKMDYANLLVQYDSSTPESVKRAESIAASVEKHSKRSVVLSEKLGSFYLSRMGSNPEFIEKALSFYDQAIYLRPFMQEQWQSRIYAYMQVVNMYVGKNDREIATKYLGRVEDIINEAASINKRNLNPFVFNSYTDENLGRLMYTKECINSGKNVVNESRFLFNNMPWLDINSDGVPDQWSKPPSINISYTDGIMSLENKDRGKPAFIESRILNFHPGKNYILELELAGTEKFESIPFVVIGVNESNQGLRLSNNMYTAEISTPKDFKPKDNVLRLFIEGKYNIKSLKIMEK